MVKKIKQLLIIVSLISLNGCFDGSGEDDLDTLGSAFHTPFVAAYLIDSPISGANYSDDYISGVTGSDGKLKYSMDSTKITIKVGGITLGAISPSNINSDTYIFPTDLVNIDRSNTNSSSVVPMLQFLQSIDSDNNPANGISIDDKTVSSLKDSTLDFTGAVSQEELSSLMSKLSKTLLTQDQAIAHYEEELRYLTSINVDTVKPLKPSTSDNKTSFATSQSSLSITIIGERDSSVYIDDIDSGVDIDSSREAKVSVSVGNADGKKNINISLVDAKSQKSDNLTISVIKDTTAPVFAQSSYRFSINENLTSIGTILATDALTNVTYSVTGTDSNSISVNSSTGELSFNTPADYETKTTYSIIANASDDAGNSSSANVSVILANINDESPVITGVTYNYDADNISDSKYNENWSTSTTVVTASFTDADDPNKSSNYIYSLSGDDASLLSISSTGIVTFTTIPDYEIRKEYKFKIVVTDDKDNSDSYDVSLYINNLNDKPPVITNDANINVQENQKSVLKITYTDEDNLLDTITYSILGDDKDSFDIDSSSGVLTFKSNPDRETKDSYSITVKATQTDYQGNDLSDSQDFTISITDVNDNPPEITQGETLDNQDLTTGSLQLSATDNDATTSLTWSITYKSDDSFSIDASNGQLTWNNSITGSQTVIVNVSDGVFPDTITIKY